MSAKKPKRSADDEAIIVVSALLASRSAPIFDAFASPQTAPPADWGSNRMQQIFESAAKGAKFPKGRRKGAISDTTAYIHALATSRAGSAAQLYKIAKRARKIGRMSPETFRGHVSQARNKK